jgi:hypothetical protein
MLTEAGMAAQTAAATVIRISRTIPDQKRAWTLCLKAVKVKLTNLTAALCPRPDTMSTRTWKRETPRVTVAKTVTLKLKHRTP